MKVVISSNDIAEPPLCSSDTKTVVVKDNSDNPIFVAIQQSEDAIWAITPDDPRFSDIVQELGITKRLAVEIR